MAFSSPILRPPWGGPTGSPLARFPTAGTHLPASSSQKTSSHSSTSCPVQNAFSPSCKGGSSPIHGGAILSLYNDPQSLYCGFERQTRVMNPSRFSKSFEGQDLRVAMQRAEDSKPDRPEFKSQLHHSQACEAFSPSGPRSGWRRHLLLSYQESMLPAHFTPL